jgi:DNA-binding SARP family transcriptional activator/Tfp pilus assembly protein PilF
MPKVNPSLEPPRIVTFEPARLADLPNRSPVRPIARIHLLGTMRAISYLGANILPKGRKARAILGCLCLANGTRIPRARLAAMLWDRVPDFQARASFRQAFRELSVAFGPLADELLSSDRETIGLNTSLCWIDAVAVVAADPSLETQRADLAARCEGELFEELNGVSPALDQWLLGERTRFTEQLRSLLETELRQVHRSNPDASARADIARRLIMFDQTHEGASRILMRALADMGERAQALREYSRCREALKVSLDVEPSPETHALYEAIRMFSARDDKGDSEPETQPRQRKRAKAAPPPAEHSRLRVGVLPFIATQANQDEGLAFSLGQEIAAALARFRWFDVVAPVSLVQRSPSGLISEEMLRRKELDYVIDGALSGDGKNYYINVRLLDLTHYASPVWSNRFALPVGELHRLDEVVTARIAGQIDPVILFIEGQPKRREHHGSMGLLLLAMPLMYSMERAKYEEAGGYIRRALEADPDNAMAAAWAAHWEIFYAGQGWCNDVDQAFKNARELALRAIKLDPDNAEALSIYAHICGFSRDFDAAIHHFDRALRLNPNLASTWAFSALTYCYIGEPQTALKRLERYRDLAPFDPYACLFETIYAIAHMFNGDYGQAVAVGKRVVTANPEFVNGYKPLIASLGHLGRIDEAKPYLEKLREIEPNFTIERFAKVYPIKKERDRDQYMAGLRAAGVPER